MKMNLNAKGKIFKTLKQASLDMPKAMCRLAKFIIENPQKAVTLNVSEIAKFSDVGEATVIRFVKNLGFPSFQDFKIDLAIEVNNIFSTEKSIIESQINEQDTPNIIGKKILSSVESAVNENIAFLNNDDIISFCNKILNADRILIVGMGTSGLGAQYFKNKLTRIGINAIYEVSSHYMYTAASLLTEKDVIITISYKASSYESIKALEIAKDAGATTSLITHYISAPVTNICDYVFYTGNNEGAMQSDALATLATQLHILEIIYTKIVQLSPQKSEKYKKVTLDALERLKN